MEWLRTCPLKPGLEYQLRSQLADAGLSCSIHLSKRILHTSARVGRIYARPLCVVQGIECIGPEL